MQVKSYQDLIAWQKAISLVTEIYGLTAQFPANELYGLTNNCDRADCFDPRQEVEAVSIAGSLAPHARSLTPDP